jgi:Skp family chaperone for outer membrane proteins
VTDRDIIAMAAMEGIVAASGKKGGCFYVKEAVAENAYLMADAMQQERDKPNKEILGSQDEVDAAQAHAREAYSTAAGHAETFAQMKAECAKRDDYIQKLRAEVDAAREKFSAECRQRGIYIQKLRAEINGLKAKSMQGHPMTATEVSMAASTLENENAILRRALRLASDAAKCAINRQRVCEQCPAWNSCRPGGGDCSDILQKHFVEEARL